MKKLKFRRVLTVFFVILGVLAVLFGCLFPLFFQRDERLAVSAETASASFDFTFTNDDVDIDVYEILNGASLKYTDSAGSSVTYDFDVNLHNDYLDTNPISFDKSVQVILTLDFKSGYSLVSGGYSFNGSYPGCYLSRSNNMIGISLDGLTTNKVSITIKVNAPASDEGVAGPVPVTLFWHNSLIKSATMVDSANNTVTFSNGVSRSPELINGQVYTVSFSYESGSDPVTKVVCDNPYITVGIHHPNDNKFTFTYNAGGPEILFGIITKSNSYDKYQTISYSISDDSSNVLFVKTEDALMPRTFYPDNSYNLYVTPFVAGQSKSFTFTVFPDTDFIFLSASQVGNGIISKVNNQDSSFVQTFHYGSSSYSSVLTISVLDISPWVDSAYADGYLKGQQDGVDQGYEFGYEAGYEDGYNAGGDSCSQQYNKGYNTGYNDGYSLGLAAGQNTTWESLNVVSLFLSPVNSFLSTPLFGSFSIGTAFSVVLVVFLAAIFIKMFAGG